MYYLSSEEILHCGLCIILFILLLVAYPLNELVYLVIMLLKSQRGWKEIRKKQNYYLGVQCNIRYNNMANISDTVNM